MASLILMILALWAELMVRHTYAQEEVTITTQSVQEKCKMLSPPGFMVVAGTEYAKPCSYYNASDTGIGLDGSQCCQHKNEPCLDIDSNCAGHKVYCHTDAAMGTRCKSTCGFCPTSPDKPGICPYYLPQYPPVIFSPRALKNCSKDDQCPGHEKCCSPPPRSGLQHDYCKEPIPNIIKPGQCPLLHPPCQRDFRSPQVQPQKCINDSQCPGHEQCCSNPCLQYKICMAPIHINKPGQCPILQLQSPPFRTDLRSPHECSYDSQCPGSEKCCPIPIPGELPYQCIEPSPNNEDFLITRSIKPGLCPEFTITTVRTAFRSSQECSNLGNDSQCPGREKCCRSSIFNMHPPYQCREPSPDNEDFLTTLSIKPGHCPLLNPQCQHDLQVQPEKCINDSQCLGHKLCCSIPCLQYEICMAPFHGQCPYLQPQSAPVRTDKCSYDSQCPGHEKCCNTISQPYTICMKPIHNNE